MRKTFTRTEANKQKISEAIKASWAARKKKYGNSQGCSDPDGRRRKIGLANKGKLVVPLGTVPWNKGLTKETEPKLMIVGVRVLFLGISQLLSLRLESSRIAHYAI